MCSVFQAIGLLLPCKKHYDTHMFFWQTFSNRLPVTEDLIKSAQKSWIENSRSDSVGIAK